MSLTPVELGADIVAVAVAATKLLTTGQALWSKLPKWLSVAIPVVVAALPTIASAAGLIKTDTDVLNLAVMAAALLVPGIAAAEKAA